MTVCIAAICEQGKCIVVAADRMVTAGPPMNLEFEHDRSKVSALTDCCVAMNAGDALLAQEILRHIRGGLQTEPDIDAIVQLLVAAYTQARQGRIEEQLRAMGMTLSTFLAEGLKQLGPLFPNLVQQITQMNAGVELLVAGFTSQGDGRLAFVHNPGAVRWFDPLGFHAIGSGGMHAAMTMISVSHSISVAPERAVLNVYTAKRNAEVAPGVGRNTDLLVLNNRKKPKAVNSAVLEELGRLYDTSRQPSAVSYDKLKELIDVPS